MLTTASEIFQLNSIKFYCDVSYAAVVDIVIVAHSSACPCTRSDMLWVCITNSRVLTAMIVSSSTGVTFIRTTGHSLKQPTGRRHRLTEYLTTSAHLCTTARRYNVFATLWIVTLHAYTYSYRPWRYTETLILWQKLTKCKQSIVSVNRGMNENFI